MSTWVCVQKMVKPKPSPQTSFSVSVSLSLSSLLPPLSFILSSLSLSRCICKRLTNFMLSTQREIRPSENCLRKTKGGGGRGIPFFKISLNFAPLIPFLSILFQHLDSLHFKLTSFLSPVGMKFEVLVY